MFFLEKCVIIKIIFHKRTIAGEKMLTIRYVTEADKPFWLSIDKHVTEAGFLQKVRGRFGYVIFRDQIPVGLFHYNVLWDMVPFLNLISIIPEARGHGYGKRAMEYWETEMRRDGYQMVLVSTQADEPAQQLYRKLGYRDCGCLILDHCPFDQPAELFMRKNLVGSI